MYTRSDGPVNVDLLFWLAIGSIIAACVTAIAARSLREFSRRELEELCEQRQNPERFAEILHCHDRLALTDCAGRAVRTA